MLLLLATTTAGFRHAAAAELRDDPRSAVCARLRLLASALPAPPLGTAPCPGVRPGAHIDADGGRCTINFVFRGNDGRGYAGTAGHCTLEGHGEITYRAGRGPAVENHSGDRIGEIAYATLGTNRDFALIRLDEGVKAKAQMCFFGGPTGWYRDRSPDPVTLNYYGNGIGVGNASAVDQPVVPARTAVARDTLDPDVVSAWGVTTQGDSGAGVVEDSTGRAVGVLVAIDSDGLMITRLAPQVAAAERALGIRLTLRTADLL